VKEMLMRFLDREILSCVHRRVGYYLLWWLIISVVFWSTTYVEMATAKGVSGVEMGVVLAAVNGPLTVLMGYVFKQYVDSRNGG